MEFYNSSIPPWNIIVGFICFCKLFQLILGQRLSLHCISNDSFLFIWRFFHLPSVFFTFNKYIINLGYCDKYDYIQKIPNLDIIYKRHRDRCDNLIPIKNKMDIYTKIELGLYTDEEIAPYFSDIHPAYLLYDTESSDDIHPASIV